MRVLVTSYLQNRERSASHSKSSLNFLEHLKERGGEGAAGNVEGGGKDLNPEDVGLVASRRIVTTLKTSVVTFEAEEEAAAGRRMGRALAKRNLSRVPSPPIYPSALLFRRMFDREIREGLFSSAPCVHPHTYPFLV